MSETKRDIPTPAGLRKLAHKLTDSIFRVGMDGSYTQSELDLLSAGEALYALADLTEPAEGWQLVPIVPTRKMCLADWNVSLSDAHTDWGVSECVWAAMLAEAPKFKP